MKNALPVLILVLLKTGTVNSQDFRFGIYANPVISWFGTDVSDVKNEGARAGFNFSVTAEKYIGDNYAITAGLSITSSGGRLVSEKPSIFRFPNYSSVVAAGNAVKYRIQYLSIPAGVKFKTNELGFLSYFAEIGFDPKIVASGKVDIPSVDIKGEKAMTEIRRFNLGYHLSAGIDYSIDGSTSAILGLGFENNFLDVTKDVGDQPTDRTSQRFIKFIFGVNF
ncbi:MAG: PorT family protein [Bacteroidales bacterium]|nr:PorT family protein [Bacteroidales bacterium]